MNSFLLINSMRNFIATQLKGIKVVDSRWSVLHRGLSVSHDGCFSFTSSATRQAHIHTDLDILNGATLVPFIVHAFVQFQSMSAVQSASFFLWFSANMCLERFECENDFVNGRLFIIFLLHHLSSNEKTEAGITTWAQSSAPLENRTSLFRQSTREYGLRVFRMWIGNWILMS